MITAVMPIRYDEDAAQAIRSIQNQNIHVHLKTAVDYNAGAAIYRNHLNNMCGEPVIIMVCDADDYNFYHRAENILNYFDKNLNIDIYCTAYTDGKRIYTPSFPEGGKPNIYHCTVSYRKRVADKIKYREGNPWTDNYEAFMFEARQAGFKFGFSNEPFVFKREKPFSLRKHIHRTIARIKIYKEFGVLWQWKTIKSLIPNITR